jgi:hypothetical protein
LRKRLLAAACAVAVTGLSAGPAFAGEITGTGKPTPIRDRAQSECAFSGLNDDEAPTPAIAQSFGQIVKVEGPLGGVPGFACNPTRAGEGE